MNNIDFHYISNCIAGFSFLTSAGIMAKLRISRAPMWQSLRSCQRFISLVFLVVGLSCCKTIFLNVGPNPDVIILSTIISASIQSLLFACTGITFVNPTFLHRRWVLTNLAIIAANATHLLLTFLLARQYFWISSVVACIVYYVLWATYQVIFFRQYRQCMEKADRLTDEYNDGRFRWIRQFFIAVSVLGLTAGIAPFLPVACYDAWMLSAACFYAYIIVSFFNYYSRSASLIIKVAEAEVEAEEDSVQQDETQSTINYSDFEQKLKQWQDNREFINNELVTEDVAVALGMSHAAFKNYFSERYGMTFRQWRTKLRIEYACRIMQENPNFAYETIAEMTGIGDKSNFTKAFKKIKGMTPKEYLQTVAHQEGV